MDTNYSMVTSDPTDSSTVEALFEWSTVTLCSSIITLIFALVAASCDIGTILTVYCSDSPRRYGYFHLLVLFCLLNLCYFIVRSFIVVFITLHSLNIIPDYFFDEHDHLFDLAPDVENCLLGTSFLLLTALAIDSLTFRCVNSKPIQKCMRIFFGLLALLLGATIFIVVLIIKHDYFLSNDANMLSKQTRLLIVTSIYAVLFTLIPIIFVTIFGTFNWVSDLNSTRALAPGRKATRLIDRRLCILSIVLLLDFLIYIIVSYSHVIQERVLYRSQDYTSAMDEASPEIQITVLVTIILKLLIECLFMLYPAMFTCAIGQFCCCCEIDH